MTALTTRYLRKLGVEGKAFGRYAVWAYFDEPCAFDRSSRNDPPARGGNVVAVCLD